MKIELWNIADVKPYPGNPRQNDDAVDAVAASLKEFGFRQPIVVDVDGVIVCGHTRFKAAQRLGLEKVPVHVAKDLTPEQIRAYRIADNQTASLATWDYDLLPIEIAGLKEANYDLGLLGFDPDELAKLLDPTLRDGLTDPDDVPAPPDAAITVRPTLVVLDDPQTDESARSLSQCSTRESVLAGAVLGLSGRARRSPGSCPAR